MSPSCVIGSNSRVLQFYNWLVLRFAGTEINYQIEQVILEILLAIYIRRKEHGIDCVPPIPRNNALDYFQRGIFFLTEGNYGEAILDFTQALKLKPDYAQAYYQRSICYGKQENLEAMNDLLRAIEIDPNLVFNPK